jgi:argininosuccinate lyase
VLSLPSGYQRDLQLTKGPLVRGLRAAETSLAILPALVLGLEFNTQRMLQAISPDMFATDAALELAASGVPFREAYRRIKERPAGLEDRDVAESLSRRSSPGSCGALMLDRIRDRLEALAARLD